MRQLNNHATGCAHVRTQADQAMALLMICNGRSRFDSNDRIMPHKSLNLRSFVPKLKVGGVSGK